MQRAMEERLKLFLIENPYARYAYIFLVSILHLLDIWRMTKTNSKVFIGTYTLLFFCSEKKFAKLKQKQPRKHIKMYILPVKWNFLSLHFIRTALSWLFFYLFDIKFVLFLEPKLCNNLIKRIIFYHNLIERT